MYSYIYNYYGTYTPLLKTKKSLFDVSQDDFWSHNTQQASTTESILGKILYTWKNMEISLK